VCRPLCALNKTHLGSTKITVSAGSCSLLKLHFSTASPFQLILVNLARTALLLWFNYTLVVTVMRFEQAQLVYSYCLLLTSVMININCARRSCCKRLGP
jgi:hypothetical protein